MIFFFLHCLGNLVFDSHTSRKTGERKYRARCCPSEWQMGCCSLQCFGLVSCISFSAFDSSCLVVVRHSGNEPDCSVVLIPQGYHNTVSCFSAFPTHGWTADCTLTFRWIKPNLSTNATKGKYQEGKFWQRSGKLRFHWQLVYSHHRNCCLLNDWCPFLLELVLDMMCGLISCTVRQH